MSAPEAGWQTLTSGSAVCAGGRSPGPAGAHRSRARGRRPHCLGPGGPWRRPAVDRSRRVCWVPGWACGQSDWVGAAGRVWTVGSSDGEGAGRTGGAGSMSRRWRRTGSEAEGLLPEIQVSRLGSRGRQGRGRPEITGRGRAWVPPGPGTDRTGSGTWSAGGYCRAGGGRDRAGSWTGSVGVRRPGIWPGGARGGRAGSAGPDGGRASIHAGRAGQVWAADQAG